ncbi:MAG: VOC family protein [Alphaproteobacteria bacterium]|nr:VOC family protein [Alphaproteobacteria bacterium]PHX98955.1 MAG: VOC family virulence protein [Rhodospirillaceae bacterium]
MPITIRDIDHVVLRVADLDRAMAFYCGILGCTLERQLEDRGLTQLRAGRSLIDLVVVGSELDRKLGAGPSDEGRNMDHFCLRVEPFDAEAIMTHLKAHGLNPGDVASRYGAEGHGPSIYLTDPDGNTVELKGPPDPPSNPLIKEPFQGVDQAVSFAKVTPNYKQN